MAQRYTEAIQDLTGRNVVAFLSQAQVEPDITVEMFFMDGPLPGFGAVEITAAAWLAFGEVVTREPVAGRGDETCGREGVNVVVEGADHQDVVGVESDAPAGACLGQPRELEDRPAGGGHDRGFRPLGVAFDAQAFTPGENDLGVGHRDGKRRGAAGRAG